MQARVGDRVAFDGKKLGQPRRTGVIRKVTQGLSGVRYQIAWDDGHETVIAPGAGNLTIEGAVRARGNSKPKPRAKPKAASKAKKAKRPKAKAKLKRSMKKGKRSR